MSHLFGFTIFTFLRNGPGSRSVSSVQGSDGENVMYLYLIFFLFIAYSSIIYFFNKCIYNFITV